MAPPEPPADPDVPHVLLFGHRGAGKSALVGALLQAGEMQGETLRGEVVHSSVDLPRIRDAVYGGAKLEPHQTELVSYILRLRPWRVGTKAVGEPLVVVLDDCDGKAAEALLEHPEPITQRAPDSPLARAVVGADAIVLLVDAASTDEQLAEAFEEFEAFLTVVGQAKTDARAVGGFPVFLVLTQCDRLAQAGDTMATWEARVRARVEAAWKAFEDFLKQAEPEDDTPSPFLPFGSIDLTVFAAAVRRPPLPGTATPLHHPYQVAELFRDCFAEARAHRTRAQSSDTRLKWTSRIAIAAVVILLLGLATVAFFPPQATGPELAEQVRDYITHEPPAAVRLSESELARNKKTLARFTADSRYPDLEPDLRAFVDSRVKEIDEYEEYRNRLATATSPADTRTLTDLRAVCKALETPPLALPPQYAWGETAAGKLHDKWRADCTAIEKAVQQFVDSYESFASAGTAMMVTRAFDSAWLKGFDALVEKADQPPEPLTSPIPGSPVLNQPRGAAVTYFVPYEFDEVYHARRDWEQTRDRVANLRDLADALGVTTAPDRPEAVLVLPEPDGVDSARLAAARWTALLRLYPRQSEGYPEWEVRNFPDPARSDLSARLKKSFDTGVRHVQKLMKVEDTKEGWKALAATLNEPVYRDWGRLLHLLARLQDPAAPDPVSELSKFLADLGTKKFELDFRAGLSLSIPLDLTAGLDRVEAVGPLTISVTHGQEPAKTFKFAVQKGEPRGTATVYRLVPESPGKIAYYAGDDLRAELPVKAGAQMLALQWETGSSNTFRFDRLTRTPRLTKSTGGTEPATGVKLTPVAPNAIPQFPVLMPVK
jgi:hypothetical protein